jgi:hypothetical protein
MRIKSEIKPARFLKPGRFGQVYLVARGKELQN